MKIRTLLVVLSCLAASGCVSTTSRDTSKVSDEDAARYNTQLGISYLRRGDLESAREKLEKAVRQDPKFPASHAALGILYERAGDPGKARDYLVRAARLAPDDPNMVNNLGGFLCRQGERAEGIRYFEQAAGNAYFRSPETALTNAGVCARGIPDLAAAEGYFRDALARNPSFPEALLQMADLKLALGEGLAARAFLQRYEAVGPTTPVSLRLGRDTERLLGNPAGAADYTRRLREDFPDAREGGSRDDG